MANVASHMRLYGGEINLLADTSSDVQGRGANASKTMVYLDGMWGRFELGSAVGAEGTMKVDAATIARATCTRNGVASGQPASSSTIQPARSGR